VDPDTDSVETVPFCTWCLYRKDVFRKIADAYAREEGPAKPEAAPQAVHPPTPAAQA
jgi:hypothetical protein